ncbi:hypothetical protein ATANTOWER_028582 [Ataeniobius toweri]|uniref:Uncharacterized protein n=1 Tax=Ataeniobius toweri TaxID=208326 RepID=A0ABU7A952_9TELE|nr:hypothetical protein [Ataeniobius toweri]
MLSCCLPVKCYFGIPSDLYFVVVRTCEIEDPRMQTRRQHVGLQCIFAVPELKKFPRKKKKKKEKFTKDDIHCRGGAGAYLQQSTGNRQVTAWTGLQSIAGKHRGTPDKQQCTQPFILKGNLERPVNITIMFLNCGRKPEYPEKTRACMERICKLHAERPLARSQTQDLLGARQQCYQLHHHAASSYYHRP